MAIDEQTKKIYYISTEVSPLERHLYSISFDGSGKRRLSQSEGTHSFSMGQNGRYYIDRWSNTEIRGRSSCGPQKMGAGCSMSIPIMKEFVNLPTVISTSRGSCFHLPHRTARSWMGIWLSPMILIVRQPIRFC